MLERFPFRDDLDDERGQEWSRRVLRAGLALVYEPRAAVRHSHAYTDRVGVPPVLRLGRVGRALVRRGRRVARRPAPRRRSVRQRGAAPGSGRRGRRRWIPYTVVYELGEVRRLQLGLRHARLPRWLVSRLSGLPAHERRFARLGPMRPSSEPQRGSGSRTTTGPRSRQPSSRRAFASRRARSRGRRRRSRRRGAPPAHAPSGPPARTRGGLPREREPVDEADLSFAERGKRRPAHEVRHREVQTRVADEPFRVRQHTAVELLPERGQAGDRGGRVARTARTRSGSRSPDRGPRDEDEHERQRLRSRQRRAAVAGTPPRSAARARHRSNRRRAGSRTTRARARAG